MKVASFYSKMSSVVERPKEIKSHEKEALEAKKDRDAAHKEHQKLKRQEKQAAKRSQWEDKIKDVKVNDILVRRFTIRQVHESGTGSKDVKVDRPSFVQVVKVLEGKSDAKRNLGLRLQVTHLTTKRRDDYIYPGDIDQPQTSFILSKEDVNDYTLHEPGKEYHAPLSTGEKAIRDFKAQLKVGVILVKEDKNQVYNNIEFQVITDPRWARRLEPKRLANNQVVPDETKATPIRFDQDDAFRYGWRIYDPTQVYISLTAPPKLDICMLDEDVKRLDQAQDQVQGQVPQKVANQLHDSVMQFLHHVPSYARKYAINAVVPFYQSMLHPLKIWDGRTRIVEYAFDIAHQEWLKKHPKI